MKPPEIPRLILPPRRYYRLHINVWGTMGGGGLLNYAKIKPLAGRNQSSRAEAAKRRGARPRVARKVRCCGLCALLRGLDLTRRSEREEKVPRLTGWTAVKECIQKAQEILPAVDVITFGGATWKIPLLQNKEGLTRRPRKTKAPRSGTSEWHSPLFLNCYHRFKGSLILTYSTRDEGASQRAIERTKVHNQEVSTGGDAVGSLLKGIVCN